ncbi:MAG: alpha/beta fold hydrolase [Roseiflexaceae bacterium]|nr:alpha/beta fold hydrolase [Roseiflexaceae bacterium]
MSGMHPLDRIWPLFAPLSRASGPLRLGMARRQLQQGGVEMRATRIDGMTINYYARSGDPSRPPLVFVHGLGDSALTWALMFGLLGEYSIYALDLPGYGLSGLPRGQTFATIAAMRSVLITFIEEQVGRPALVVGNSMGGWLAAEVARTKLDTTRGLVLINPGGALLDGALSYEEFRALLAADDLASARLVLRRMFGAVPRPLLYVSQSAIQDIFKRPVVRDFMASVTEQEFLQAEDLQALAVPILLLWGETDAFLPSGSLEFFRKNLAAAETHILAGVGHVPQNERPRQIAALIEAFASRL